MTFLSLSISCTKSSLSPPHTATLTHQEENRLTYCNTQTQQQRAEIKTSSMLNRICDGNRTAAHRTETQWRTAALQCTEGQISSTQRGEGSLGSTQLQRAAQQQWREAVKHRKAESNSVSLFLFSMATQSPAKQVFTALQQTHKHERISRSV